MRFICEIGDAEYIVEAETFEAAARAAAQLHAQAKGPPSGTYTVNVAEANEADYPLVVGEDYTVTLPG